MKQIYTAFLHHLCRVFCHSFETETDTATIHQKDGWRWMYVLMRNSTLLGWKPVLTEQSTGGKWKSILIVFFLRGRALWPSPFSTNWLWPRSHTDQLCNSTMVDGWVPWNQHLLGHLLPWTLSHGRLGEEWDLIPSGSHLLLLCLLWNSPCFFISSSHMRKEGKMCLCRSTMIDRWAYPVESSCVDKSGPLQFCKVLCDILIVHELAKRL